MLDLNVKLFARLFRSHQQFRYVPHLDLMADRSAVCAGIVRSSCGTHLLDHLAADRAGLTGRQITVVAFLEVDANLPWCTPNILKSPFAHVFALQHCKKRGKRPCTTQCETGATLVYTEDTIGTLSRTKGMIRKERLESADSTQ